MTKLVAAFALGVIVTALIAFATQGRVEKASQIVPLQMMKGQHPPQAEFTDYSLVFP
ncbi:MAG TPA: hypothetical protein VGU20_02660 [Stellaceae bacterium]|nr:hypothetical protein [Stellaceae bacterium]